VKVISSSQANAVFVLLTPVLEDALRKRGWMFYTFIGNGGCRLMCAWDTTEEDVDAFLGDLKSVLPTSVPPNKPLATKE
jgi:threonine aldolase